MLSRLNHGPSLTTQFVYWLPHTVIVAAGLKRAKFRPVLLLVPGRIL